MNREQIKLMNEQGKEKRLASSREEFEGDPALARKFWEEAAVDRVEGLLKLWKEWYPDKLSYHDESEFVREFSSALRDMRKHAGKSPEPRPEYDEMISCFLPRKQRQELKDKGLNQQQITEVAKEQILTAEWVDEKDTEEMREKAGADYFIGHYTGFSSETCEMLSKEEQTFHTRKKTGELEEFITRKQGEFSLEDYLRFVGNRRLSRCDMAEYAEKIQNAQKEAAKKAERAPEPKVETKVETKKEPVSLKSVFSAVKGFVKHVTMSADEKARIADEKARIAAEEKRAAAEKAKINKLKTTLERGGWYGKQSVKTLNDSEYRIGFDSLGSVASSIDPEAKTITLNPAMSDETQIMSLVNAACVLKQEKDGAGKSPEVMAVRKADVFMTQVEVALRLDPYKEKYTTLFNNKLYGVYDNVYKQEEHRFYSEEDEYIDKPKATVDRHAQSSFVDAYLDKVLPADKRPSPEQIAKVCRDFEGKNYYTPDNWYSKIGKKEMAAGQSDQTEFKKPDSVYKEKITPAMIAKAKQNGR